MGKKLWKHISFSSTCFCCHRKHPNNDVIRFAHYHLLLTLNSTFQTDSQFLGIIQIWQNLNEHQLLTSTTSVIFQKEANCSPFQSLDLLSFHTFNVLNRCITASFGIFLNIILKLAHSFSYLHLRV